LTIFQVPLTEEYHPLFLIDLPVGYLIVSFLFSRQ